MKHRRKRSRDIPKHFSHANYVSPIGTQSEEKGERFFRTTKGRVIKQQMKKGMRYNMRAGNLF